MPASSIKAVRNPPLTGEALGLGQRLRAQLERLPCRRLLVGFSGGLDSTALLHVAAGLDSGLTALHINHGLHPEADAWESHCAAFCRRLGARFLSRPAQPAGKREADARAARYQAFNGLLQAEDLLLLAHHRDDQAETVLLRLLQGRGGLGMPRTRRLHCGARILRPWLEAPRSDLLAYARQANLHWLEDPANADRAHDRNFLRHEILPQLIARWPGADAALAAGADVQQARDALLAYLLDPVRGDAPPAADACEIDLAAFPEELRATALRLWLGGLGEFGAAHAALAEFARQLDAPADAQPELKLTRGALRRRRNRVCYIQTALNIQPSYPLDPPGELNLPQGQLIAAAAGEGGGFHAPGPLEIRFRQGGERLLCRGKSRSVKKLLQAAGIPPWERKTHPLVYGNGQLLALPGIAVADTPNQEPRWQVQWRPV